MKRCKSALYLATVASCAIATVAIAQPGPNDGDNSLHGTGATSIQNVLVQEFNCIDGANQLGLPSPTPNGSFSTISEPVITVPASGSTPSTPFNCATQRLLTGFSAKYIGTGSGFGRQAWRTNTNQFTGGTNNNPWEKISGQLPWATIQFAFADSSITASDRATYITNNSATAGAPIMFPLYALPVAIAYNPVYGTNSTGNPMRFRSPATTPRAINGVTVGGMKLTPELYCGIFNGQIKNWNDARFKAANGGTDIFDATNDTLARWTSQGAPIRLVGRVDRSGTTDIFTRALAAQCDSFGTNAYDRAAETLPYNRTLPASQLPDFTSVRSDSGLRPASTEKESGNSTSLLVGNTYFNGSGYTTVTGGSASQPAANSTNGSGLFMVANGSGGVRDAINFAPDHVVTSTTFGTTTFNGKVGYISADYIANSPTGSATLFAAALQAGDGTYSLPTGNAASQAVNAAVLPPQSNASGTYNAGADTRQVRDPNDLTEATLINATRTNPLAWYDVLYSDPASTLANPAAGYRITGTTQFLGYTCYKASNAPYIRNFLGWNTGNLTTDDSGTVRTGIFTNLSTGLLDRSNLAPMPTDWQRAIRDTFLNTTLNASGLQLNIEAAAASGTNHCNLGATAGR